MAADQSRMRALYDQAVLHWQDEGFLIMAIRNTVRNEKITALEQIKLIMLILVNSSDSTRGSVGASSVRL